MFSFAQHQIVFVNQKITDLFAVKTITTELLTLDLGNPHHITGCLASDGAIDSSDGIDTIETIKVHHIINEVVEFFFGHGWFP